MGLRDDLQALAEHMDRIGADAGHEAVIGRVGD